jgi:hypothetical protein
MKCACAILSSVACSALQYFSTLSHKRHDFRENVLEHKTCVLIFSTTFVWNISHYTRKKKWVRYDQKCMLVFMQSTRYCLMKFQFSWQIVEKCSNIKFHENPSSESRVVPCGQTDGGQREGQTDGQADMTNLTDACRNFANAPKTEKGQLHYFYTSTERT